MDLRRPLTRRPSDAVAAHVRQLRVARNWSQEQLANEAGMSKDAVSRIERGDRRARLDTLEQIANAFGLPLPKLLDVGHMLPSNPEDERRARLLKKSLEQLPPWLAEALPSAIRIVARAARKQNTRSDGRPRAPNKKKVIGRPKSAPRKHPEG